MKLDIYFPKSHATQEPRVADCCLRCSLCGCLMRFADDGFDFVCLTCSFHGIQITMKQQCVSVCVCKCVRILLIDLLENVLESSIILLQNGVLGAEVQRPAFHQSHLKGAVSKVPDGFVRIVHPQCHAASAYTQICTV